MKVEFEFNRNELIPASGRLETAEYALRELADEFASMKAQAKAEERANRKFQIPNAGRRAHPFLPQTCPDFLKWEL